MCWVTVFWESWYILSDRGYGVEIIALTMSISLLYFLERAEKLQPISFHINSPKDFIEWSSGKNVCLVGFSLGHILSASFSPNVEEANKAWKRTQSIAD
jgi:hypothetical protein